MTQFSILGGIYFIVPFPEGWEVCAFPFKIYPDAGGHALMWDMIVSRHLAMRWARVLFTHEQLDKTPILIKRLAVSLSTLYDAVPRGRAELPLEGSEKINIYHGDDLKPWMQASKNQIENALRLNGGAKWVRDDHERCNSDSAARFCQLLKMKFSWEA